MGFYPFLHFLCSVFLWTHLSSLLGGFSRFVFSPVPLCFFIFLLPFLPLTRRIFFACNLVFLLLYMHHICLVLFYSRLWLLLYILLIFSCLMSCEVLCSRGKGSPQMCTLTSCRGSMQSLKSPLSLLQ